MSTNLLFSIVIFLSLHTPPAEAGVKIIVNKQNKLSALSQEDLINIYLAKSDLSEDKLYLIPVELPTNHAIWHTFVEKILGKSSREYIGYWTHKIFTGNGQSPIQRPSDRDVIEYVAQNAKAIGYIDSQENTDDRVKVVATYP